MFDRPIAFQARQNPRAPAIVALSGDTSFAQFEDEIAAVAHWAQGLRLERDRAVVVRIADRRLHWLTLLALMRLGVPSGSVAEAASTADIQRFSPQRLITDRDDGADAISALCPLIEFTTAIARSLRQSDNRLAAGPAIDTAGLARLATSSGTTGAPKLLGFSWSDVAARLAASSRSAASGASRVLGLIGPEIGSVERGLRAWASGGAVVFGPRTPGELAEALPRLAPASIAGAPTQLQVLMAALPEGFAPMRSMRVTLFGAHTPSELRRQISLRLSPNIHNIYATTEAGTIARASAAQLTEPTAVGYVPPGVDVEIVDEDDRACAPERQGILRVRGPAVARGYLNDPIATQAHFRDGWFYPGDAGLLTADGLLHLHGRTNEVVNLGGDKAMPLVIEEAARSCRSVTDAAAFMAPAEGGVESLWVALVCSAPVDQDQLFDRLVRVGAVTANLIYVDDIPRNPRGKILRDVLRRRVVASIGT